MATERRRHLKAEIGISEAAQGIIRAAFEEGEKTYKEIAKNVLLTTGEQIGPSSVQRAWVVWNLRRMNREVRERSLQQLQELKKLPPEKLDEAIEQILRTIAFDELASGKPGDFDPGKLLRALTARDRVKQLQQQHELELRRLEQRGALPIEQALEMWETIVGILHKVNAEAGAALSQHADQVIDGLKAKYA